MAQENCYTYNVECYRTETNETNFWVNFFNHNIPCKPVHSHRVKTQLFLSRKLKTFNIAPRLLLTLSLDVTLADLKCPFPTENSDILASALHTCIFLPLPVGQVRWSNDIVSAVEGANNLTLLR